MSLNCPRCSSQTTELRECDNCNEIGCHKCMKKTKTGWFCFKCESKSIESNQEGTVPNIFSDMFG